MPGNSLFSSSHWKNVSRSISLRYTLCCCPVVQLSWEVPFIIFEWLVYELPAVNQRVSSSVFQRSPIIIVVGLNFWLHIFNMCGKGWQRGYFIIYCGCFKVTTISVFLFINYDLLMNFPCGLDHYQAINAQV